VDFSEYPRSLSLGSVSLFTVIVISNDDDNKSEQSVTWKWRKKRKTLGEELVAALKIDVK
jgi:hypothetical protein